MTSNSKSQAQVDWQYVFLGAAVAIAGTAYAGTAMFNLVTSVLVSQGATQQDVYAYFASPSLTLVGMISFAYSATFGFLCGRVATMRTKKRSLISGVIAGCFALSFQGVMALGVTPDPRAVWQIALGLIVPLLGSILGASSRSAD